MTETKTTVLAALAEIDKTGKVTMENAMILWDFPWLYHSPGGAAGPVVLNERGREMLEAA